MNLFNRLPVLWKVLSAPAIAMICMAVYLGSTIIVFKQNNVRLVNVRDVQFPVLDAITENASALDKIIDILNASASSGESEQLAVADNLAKKVRANYERLHGIDKERAKALQRLSSEFDAYYSNAREVAEMMALQSGLPAKSKMQAMVATLDTYRKDLTAFRGESNQRFIGTVGDATSAADRAMLSGAVIGAIGLALTLTFAIVVARAFLRQLNQALAVAETVAAGDLTSIIEITSMDETGKLLHALKEMNSSLVRIVGQVRAATSTISSTSVHISRGNTDLSARTEKEARTLEETALAITNLPTPPSRTPTARHKPTNWWRLPQAWPRRAARQSRASSIR